VLGEIHRSRSSHLEWAQMNYLEGQVRGKARWATWDRVCERFSVDEIASAVRLQIKARTTPEVARLP